MEVRELTLKGESDPKLYACGKCGSVRSPKIYACREDKAHAVARRAAEECCAPKYCGCGVELEGSWTACAPCRERNMIARATIVEASEYHGPVSAACNGEWSEGYSSSIGAMIESCQDADEPIPAYCHPCTEMPLRLDPTSLLEQAVDDMHEEAGDQIEDADGLIAFISQWNEKQTYVSYYEDRSRVIILDKARFEDILNRPATQST